MKKFRLEIKWALAFMIMSLLWMLLEKLAGLHSLHIDKHMYLTNLFAIPAILLYILALIDIKKKRYKGQITYVESFISGMKITVIITLFAPLTQWITSILITPEYFTNVIAYSVETGYYKSVEEAKAYFNLINYITQSVIGSFIMGTVTTSIISIFIKTKSKK